MIHGFVMAALLYGPHTPEAERIKRLSELFDPKPGQLLTFDRISDLENSKNPERIKGEIWIRPPQGQCLIIRSNYDARDLTICKPTPYKWTVDNLDSLGRLRLHATIIAEWDDGSFLTWETPYRIGNFVAAGDKDSGLYEDILIRKCQASVIDEERVVSLEAFDGRRWKITLPEYDTPVLDVEPEIPNLMVNVDTKKIAEDNAAKAKEKEKAAEEKGHGADGEKKADGDKKDDKSNKDAPKPTDPKDAAPASSVLGTLLTRGYKDLEKQVVAFNIPKRGAYRMESGRFSETGSPKGMTGECRYIFQNAPGDKKSGAIECHDTDTMDSLYVHVPCFSELKVREKPKSEKKDGKESKK